MFFHLVKNSRFSEGDSILTTTRHGFSFAKKLCFDFICVEIVLNGTRNKFFLVEFNEKSRTEEELIIEGVVGPL